MINMNRYQFLYVKVILMLVMLVFANTHSYASGLIAIGPKETRINGSIKYSVIGKYIAQFSAFQGTITFDEQSNKLQSVYLEIQTASIQSDCRWCDKIVRSEQLLAVTKCPKIIFQSSELIPNEEGYAVKGILDLHGIKKEMSFPFQVKMDSKDKTLDAKGQWMIKRKDFNITWNKFLDQGGVLVGNYIMVDWGIKAGY